MNDSNPMQSGQAGSDATIGRLVADASRDLSALVRSEIQLAKSELKISVNAGGMAIALLAVAAFLGLLLIVMLSITLAFFITMTGLHAAWAFLIVSGLYVLMIVVLGFIAWRKFRRVKAPSRTIATAKEIPAALSGQGTKAGAEPNRS